MEETEREVRREGGEGRGGEVGEEGGREVKFDLR